MSEYAEVCICDKPKARKEHRCCECGGIIGIGEIYHRYHGVFDGSGFTYKMCPECDQLRTIIDVDTPSYEEYVAFTELEEVVSEIDELEILIAFLTIKEQRRANIPKYLVDRVDELVNKEDDVYEDDTEEHN